MVGLPGETVQIKDGQVYIDGEVLIKDIYCYDITTPGVAEKRLNWVKMSILYSAIIMRAVMTAVWRTWEMYTGGIFTVRHGLLPVLDRISDLLISSKII